MAVSLNEVCYLRLCGLSGLAWGYWSTDVGWAVWLVRLYSEGEDAVNCLPRWLRCKENISAQKECSQSKYAADQQRTS